MTPNAPQPVLPPEWTASFMEGVIVRPWRDGWVEVVRVLDGAQRAALKTAPREKP